MTAFDIFLAQNGFKQAIGLPLDGEYHRFDRAGVLSGWVRGRIVDIDGRKIIKARCGDWRTDETYEFDDVASQNLSPEEQAKITEVLEALALQEKASKAKRQEEVALECQAIWKTCIPMGNTAYLARKQIPLLRARLLPNDPATIVVPIGDLDGKIWSLQFIGPEPGPESKKFKPGGRIKGGMFWVDNKQPGNNGEGVTIYVAEGFATAGSVHLATGQPTACAFNAGNLEPVGKALRHRYPNCRLVFCGDDDRWGKDPNGSPLRNSGREKATAAARSCNGITKFPDFGPNPDASVRPTDFNDLHIRHGLDLVRAQLLSSKQDAGTPGSSDSQIPGGIPYADADDPGPGSSPTPAMGDKSPEKKKVTEKQLADGLLAHFGLDILRQDKSLFLYDGKRWREVTLAGIDAIKNRLNAMVGGVLDSKKVNSAYQTFFRYVPAVPENVNLFNPHPFCANFENGTLHIRQAKDHTYTLEFLPHRREDYVINLLPYEYSASKLDAVNSEFEAMLGRLFEGESDASDKIRAIGQMYGACLVPAFPHFFMLWGKPKTGKSTVIQIAEQMVASGNRSSVQPHQFNGFNMESMVGKLVNTDPDINTREPITDDQIKKVIDRREFRIRRKGIADAYGFIPAVHIFGGQEIPPTLEGATGAHDRRWTFLGFHQVQGGAGLYDKEYWRWVWDKDPWGVVAFAVRGLMDLCSQRGHYTQPQSSKDKMKKWQESGDFFAQFFADIDAGEIVDKNQCLKFDKTTQIKRTLLWEAYKKWHEVFVGSPPRTPQRSALFERVVARGAVLKTIKGYDYYEGVGYVDFPDGQF